MRRALKPASVLPILCVVVALAGSIWGVARDNGCSICSESSTIVGGLNLGALGIAFYGLLLAAALYAVVCCSVNIRSAASRVVTIGLLLAGGVHFTLLTLLIRHRIFCSPCILTALAALTGALCVLLTRGRLMPRAAALVAATAVFSYAGTKVLQRSAAKNDVRVAARAERQLVREHRTPPVGRALMVVYARTTCHWCRKFKAEVMPPLVNEFGQDLTVEERTAWRSMSTPTIVILGRTNSRFVGFEPLNTIRTAVRLARGVDLPPSRSRAVASSD